MLFGDKRCDVNVIRDLANDRGAWANIPTVTPFKLGNAVSRQ
jgi:hypothetical protein